MSTVTDRPTVDTGLRGFLGFLKQSARKRFVLLVRYPVNTISRFGTVFIVFLVLFFGGQALAPAAMNDQLGGLIVGYLLWSVSITAYSGLSWNVTREAQWGTLEQLFMSPHGFGRVMAGKTLVNVVESLCWGAVTLGFMLLVTGESLAVDPLTVVPLGVLALAPAVGIGFLFGGLAIRFKRIENAFQLMQFGFIFLISAPVRDVPALKWLPLAQGSNLLRRAMQDGMPLTAIPAGELAILVATAVGYLALGYGAFTYCQRWARRAGVMGHY
jgi:ABC-2 type transport system permease protein